MTRIMTVAVYLVLLSGIVVAAVLPRRYPEVLSPVGSLLDELLSARSARVGMLVFWWWVGWHFLVA